MFRLNRWWPKSWNRNPLRRPISVTNWWQLRHLEDRCVPATFFVDNINNSGTGSLREAILDANAAAGSDLILFDIATFSTAKTITLTTGELGITGPVSINGPTKAALTINAAGTGRVFNINDGTATEVAVNLERMAITGGVVTGIINGAGIFSTEALTMDNVTVTGNSGNAGGGGIAIGTGGTLTATDTTFSSNNAGAGVGSIGGGIFALSSGNVLLERCTVSNNFAGSSAGGIYFSSGASTLTIRNSTISSNSANLGNGGILLSSSVTSTLSIENSTITGNTGGSGGAVSRGGAAPASIILISSIVADNNAAGDITTSGSVSADHSFIGNKTGIGNLINIGGTSIVGGSPGLLPLTSNGGTTQTHAVPPGSPALNVGSNNLSLTTDQRGMTRSEGVTDMGAFEVHVPTAAATLADVTTAGATVHSFTVTYSDEVAVKVSSLDSSDVRVTGPNGFNVLATFKSVNIGTDGTPRTATYDFTPPGGSWNDGDGGTYTVSVETNQVQDTHGFSAAAKAVDTFNVLLGRSFIVTNANDAGAGSLRQALTDANAFTPTNDTVTFDPAVFASAKTISLLTVLPSIVDDVSILGTGASLLTVRRDPAAVSKFGVFQLNNGSTLLVVNMSDLTITQGDASLVGGGITIGDADNVTLDRVVMTGNKSGSSGGGISIVQGSLTLRDCTISGNTSFDGGGILGSAANITVERSTLSNNTATSGGGGLSIGSLGSLLIRNSTVSGNSAVAGGGLRLSGFTGAATIQNTTITANTASSSGGGLSISTGNPVTSLESTIVSGNTAGSANPDIVSGFSMSFKNCAIGSSSGLTFSDLGGNLLFGTALNLAALAGNGGPTQTHAILPGSPLINAGSNPASLSIDQRGSGFARSVGVTDIGSFEAPVFPAKVTSVQVNDGSAQRSRVTSLLVTFDSPPALPGAPSSAFQLKRQSDNAVVTVSAMTSGNTVTLTFTGGPVDFGSLADGRYTLTALASQISNLDGDGNGAVGDDYVLVGDTVTAPKLFRLFGDITGDGAVAGNDFTQFRLSFGGVNPDFDFNNDGAVSASDFTQFRQRFGSSI